VRAAIRADKEGACNERKRKSKADELANIYATQIEIKATGGSVRRPHGMSGFARVEGERFWYPGVVGSVWVIQLGCGGVCGDVLYLENCPTSRR
jgi:hypothetical protein